MILDIRAVAFKVNVGGQTIRVADTPHLRFRLSKLAVHPETGELAPFSLPEPEYDRVEDLMDMPIPGRRIPRPLPPYPTDLTETIGAWIFSTSDLALDLWLQTSCAYMTALAREPAQPGRPKPVKPLYKFEVGVALRFKAKGDRELWVRRPISDKHPNVLGPWKPGSLKAGEWIDRADGVYWGMPTTANELIDSTPTIALPQDQPRDTWVVRSHVLMRSIPLPYSPSPGAPAPNPEPQEWEIA